MEISNLKSTIDQLLGSAGIHINGSQPWDIRVYNDKFYSRALTEGTVGVGEAYVKGWWDCLQLDELFTRLLNANIDEKIKTNWKALTQIFLSKILNRQTRHLAIRNGQKHYDIGRDVFERMLDKRLTYTCAYWKDATTLDAAQEQKLELTCRKIGLRPGMRVLDIGCGWGSFVQYAAERYDVHVTGITVSEDQTEYTRALCKTLPVEVRLMDYRDIDGKYDRIVSLGMFEHVGYKNYRTFMQKVHQCLKEDGLFLLHTIGGNTSHTAIDPWINKYIFPGSMLPSIRQIGAAIEGLFVMEDWHNFSAYYDKTLIAWHENFRQGWDEISEKYGEAFFRLWSYYLLMCAGTFRSRKNQLWQIVLSKHGVPGGYEPVR